MKSLNQQIKSWKNTYESRSIFGKVLTGYLFLAIIVIVVTTLISYFLLHNYTIGTTKHELMDKSALIAHMMNTSAVPDTEEDPIATYKLLSQYESLADAQMLLVGPDLIVRHLPFGVTPDYVETTEDLELAQSNVIDALDRELIYSILNGETACDLRDVRFLNASVVFAGAPIETEGVITGALLLYRTLDEIKEVSTNLLYMTLIGGMSAILLAVTLALILSSHFTRPLSLLNATAKRMAEGHYGERVSVRQKDEIGELGDTLNQLTSRLSQVITSLNDEKSKLEQIIAGIGEGIMAIDQSGEVIHQNECAMTMLEGHVSDDDTPSMHQRLLTLLAEVATEGSRQSVKWTNEAARSIAINVWPVMSAEESILGAVALMRDVTEAEQLEQMRRDYIANISHELRTPLTGIRGMVEPLMDDYIETEEEKHECYQVIYQETRRLEKLIGDMLDMSRLQDGRAKIELEPVVVAGALGAAVRRMRGHAEEGEINLYADAPAGLPLVLCNEDRVLQVLIILIDNALSFTPPGGEVAVYARQEADHVVLGVRDTGAGIDPKDLPYIWERFYKADKSRMRTTGTGLGLAIAKLTVELMGGVIGVKSELGHGATFEFTLQIADEQYDDEDDMYYDMPEENASSPL